MTFENVDPQWRDKVIKELDAWEPVIVMSEKAGYVRHTGWTFREVRDLIQRDLKAPTQQDFQNIIRQLIEAVVSELADFEYNHKSATKRKAKSKKTTIR